MSDKEQATRLADGERGHVVVSRTQDGHLAAVTRQDDEHRILSVIADTASLRERIAALEADLRSEVEWRASACAEIAALEAALAERDEVLEIARQALESHMAQTRVIQRSVDALRAIEEVR